MKNELITIKEFLKMCNIGKTTFYKWIANKQIQVIKIGRKSLISAFDANNFIVGLRDKSKKWQI